MSDPAKPKPKILIADDSPTVTGILNFIFSEEGFSVETAADGVEAIRRFYQNPPNVLVLDIEMPRMNGYQVCRIIKDDPDTAAIPVVMLTSRDLQSDRFRGLASGADTYLVKNLEDDLLLTTVREIIARQASGPFTSPKSRVVNDGEILQAVNRILDRKLFITTVLSQVDAVVAEASDWEGVRREIVQLLSRVFEFVAGGLLISGPEGPEATISLLERFQLPAIEEQFLQRLAKEASQLGIDLKSPLISRTLAHSPAGSKMFPRSELLTDWLFQPLCSGGKPFGLVGMSGTTQLKFDQEGRELFLQFVRKAETVLDNARLIALTEAANQNLSRAMEELRNTEAQLIHSEKMASLGQLMAGLTHEMNNPLNFVAGNLDHLEEYVASLLKVVEVADKPDSFRQVMEEEDYSFLKDDLPGLMHDLREGVMRLRGIIGDLRTFSSQDRGEAMPADLAAILESTLNILRHEWEGKCEIVRLIDALPPYECNSGQIGQVAMNLLSNAIRAVRDSGSVGKVTVSLGQMGEFIEIGIADEGVGIPAGNREKLFQPFFTTREIGQGMGLGLSISYGIVKRHSGEILVESEPGRGSQFTVRLPLHTEAA